jgi:hypothetical protein
MSPIPGFDAIEIVISIKITPVPGYNFEVISSSKFLIKRHSRVDGEL